MKKCFKIKTISCLLSILLLFTNSITIYAADTSRAAKITDLAGTVNVFKSGGEKKFSAFKGMSLTQGDSIATGKDSWVELEIDDDKLVKISENTRLGVCELAGSVSAGDDQTGLKLWFGNVWTNLKNKLNIRSKYEIRTPKTVMGVRGTQFYVGMDNQNTVVAVLEGRVLAITYSTEQRPDGTVLEQAVQAFIEQNQQTSIAEASGGEAVISVAPVSLRDIDPAVLVEILQTPQGISEEILNETANVLQERINEIPPNTIVDLLRNTQDLPPALRQEANNSLQQRIDEFDPSTLQDILNNPQGIDQDTLQKVQTESLKRPPIDNSSGDEEMPGESNIIPAPSPTPGSNTGSGSGSGSGGNTITAVESVIIDPTSIVLEVGDEAQLNAIIYPDDATNKAVTWRSYNTHVADVSDNGLVEAIGQGTTEIEVTTVDGEKTATCTVYVIGSSGGNTSEYLENIDAFYYNGKIILQFEYNTANKVTGTINYESEAFEIYSENQSGYNQVHTHTLYFLENPESYPYNSGYTYELIFLDSQDTELDRITGHIPAINNIKLSLGATGDIKVSGNAYSVDEIMLSVENSSNDTIFESNSIDIVGDAFNYSITDPHEFDMPNGVYDIVLTVDDPDGKDFGIVIGYIIKTDYGITIKERTW